MKITGGVIGIISVVLLGLGIILCGMSGYFIIREQHFLQTAEQTTAVVTDNKLYNYTGNYNDYGVQHYYCSEFQFQTKSGQSVLFEEKNDCGQLDSPPNYQVGQKVAIYYDPQNPADTVQMQGDRTSAAIAEAVAGAIGALFVLVGLGMLWFGLWVRRKAAASRAA